MYALSTHLILPSILPHAVKYGDISMLTFNRANDLLMDIDLETIIDTNDIRLIWSNWKKIFLDIMDECIPTSVLPNRENLPQGYNPTNA